MSEATSSKSLGKALNLGDSYNRKARFLPGVLSIAVLIPLSSAFGGPLIGWISSLLAGAGLSALLGTAVSQFASLAGNRYQRKLWPRWPHDSPTNRWLSPNDTSRSQQQKKIWYSAIKRLTQLSISSVAKLGDAIELDRVINDSVSRIRNQLWRKPIADRLDLHNAEFGFARNLAGLRVIWLTAATVSCAGCWLGSTMYGTLRFWSVVSTVILAICIIFATCASAFVHQRADRYAESFFAALLALDEQFASESGELE
nr:hypothetical protein [Nitrosomonas nitrosa]